MDTTITHMPLTEFEHDPIEVFRRVTNERLTVVVEDKSGKKMVLRPVVNEKAAQPKGKKTPINYDALAAAAGSWHDVNIDMFLQQVYESRTISTRPLAKL